MREIEVKIRTKDLRAVERSLAARGCTLSAPIHQEDTIYVSSGPAAKKFENPREGNVIVRIRREDDKAIFTLKKTRTHELDNIEIETEIADPDALHRALLLLGCTPVVEVKKVRRKGRLINYEICLDEVEKLGSFVELEKLTREDDDAAAATDELLRTLESLGLSRNDREMHGYDTLTYRQMHGQSS